MSLKTVIQRHYNNVGSRIVFLPLSVLVAIELIDTLIGNISDFQYDIKYSFLKFFLSSQSAIYFYIILASLFILFQSLFLYSIKSYQKQNGKFDNLLYNITIALHLLLTSLIVIVLFNIIAYSSYPFLLLKISVGIGFTYASLIFFLLAYKLINWYRNTNNKILLLFSFAFLILGFTKINFELGIFLMRYDYSSIVNLNTIAEFPDLTGNSLFLFIFRDLYWISATTSFILLWLGTVFLIHRYKDTIGAKKYYTIIFLSILIFIPTPFGIYLDRSKIGDLIDPIVFYSITTFNATIVSILFFITFWIFSRNIDNDRLKKYLLLVGIGLLLYFISDQATIEEHAFPPYGLISITFLGFSSFLIFEGLFSTSVLLAKDDKLRKLVYSQLKEKFLYDISLGELYTKNEKLVADRVLKKNVDIMDSNIPKIEIDIQKVMSDVLDSLMEIREEENKKNGYVTLSFNCIKCRELYEVQINNKSLAKTLYYGNNRSPVLEKFECHVCKNEIQLSKIYK